MDRIGGRAVVLGASMGGLLAARVLADLYDSVTVVERDVLPDGAANRRGVPQGRHVHALLGRGTGILEELLPGITGDLDAAGVPALDYTDMSKMYLCLGGHPSMPSGGFKNVPSLYMPSRPLLEGLVRRRVRAIPNVTVLDGHDLIDIVTNASRDRIIGARVRPHHGGGDEVLTADLVVDSTGRGSRTPAFVEGLGYGRPAEESVSVRVIYSSQLLHMPAHTIDEMIALVSPVPGRPTGMALIGYENDMWGFTVFGMAGHEPPGELSEMVDFAAGLAPRHVLEAVRAATPVADVCRFRYPESRWRRYDQMRRFPDGFLVLGDAICSFNPIYGQGMTVAALQAKALQDSLRAGTAGLARRYFRAAAEPIGVAWQFAVGGDLSLPEVEGHRSLSMKLMGRYVDRVQAASEHDVDVAEQFIRVVGLLDPPQRLLHPRIALRALSPRRRSHPAERVPVAEGTAG
ncbi:2-polyprenyl-6-methoxyphenol hydroxylase-like oxidoreductase [Mycobacterium sp. CPCC 205372]|uniref:2-polyprenyl-6-methoxyphenol hydroxylase-like oxidoreductase n=1 Tax=Mycobacterium hippophais TaxID=3016340 RepID=A0ABT4Q043_9MYCO|nr:2-polyprenyl-6-methoxyphenol hydroxylase-like oxidoreductase [Mycobacterium hippophais]MCZ8382155.1 2-polyprenyl-6-methoxyphenol hydroxylase-like oxidoreductase [Mycobacterium hippophais]